jgi:hypothetical protein
MDVKGVAVRQAARISPTLVDRIRITAARGNLIRHVLPERTRMERITRHAGHSEKSSVESAAERLEVKGRESSGL